MELLKVAAAAFALISAGCASTPTAPGAARVILVGDSTIAPKSGWGDAFCGQFIASVSCTNMAKGGRSSKSYRAEGSWAQVMAKLAEPGGRTWVIVSFGHNDQPGKDDRSSDFATEFAPNMQRYVADIRAAGATPVLLTPLTRRQFRGGVLEDGLAAWSATIRRIAYEQKAPLLDLASDSVIAVQALGPVKVMQFAMGAAPASVIDAAKSGTTIEAPKDGPTQAPGLSNAERETYGDPKGVFDYTHLGPIGAAYFATMVREETVRAAPDLARFFKPRP